MTRRKKVSKNEFRYNYNTKHMNYVFEEDGKYYHSIGLTTKSKTSKKKNMPLFENPKRGSDKQSFVRNGIITNKKKNYSATSDRRFRFSDIDFPNVKSKIRKYKSSRKKWHKKNKHLSTGDSYPQLQMQLLDACWYYYMQNK